MNPAKRRRLDQANTTLTRPFRSPVAAKSQDNLPSNQHVDAERQSPAPVSPLAQRLQNTNTKILSSSNTSRQLPLSPPSRPLLPPPRNVSNQNRDRKYVTLQKQHSSLTLQLTKLNQSLDTAQQAYKIESLGQDLELEILIAKWQLAARDVAEELFATAKDRVNKMGGVGAWRERTQQPPDTGWNNEPEVDEDELTEEQKEMLEGQRDELKRETEKYFPPIPEPTASNDDDSFTMDMMLKQLNVELDVIGYDSSLQRWVG